MALNDRLAPGYPNPEKKGEKATPNGAYLKNNVRRSWSPACGAVPCVSASLKTIAAPARACTLRTRGWRPWLRSRRASGIRKQLLCVPGIQQKLPVEPCVSVSS